MTMVVVVLVLVGVVWRFRSGDCYPVLVIVKWLLWCCCGVVVFVGVVVVVVGDDDVVVGVGGVGVFVYINVV